MERTYSYIICNSESLQSYWGFKSKEETMENVYSFISAFCNSRTPKASLEIFVKGETILKGILVYDKKEVRVDMQRF